MKRLCGLLLLVFFVGLSAPAQNLGPGYTPTPTPNSRTLNLAAGAAFCGSPTSTIRVRKDRKRARFVWRERPKAVGRKQ